tara:strand:+ start:776 stop:1246 length:471 start_codon:yes stop_codon:yes gene_type:complete
MWSLSNYIMKKNLIINILIILFFMNSNVFSKESSYFIEGIKHFNNQEFDKSKIFFERDLVFNPKSEKSYLFLAKIFNEKKNVEEEEINLKNVLLINPKNDEAIYMLTLIKIDQSDYSEAENLINTFTLVCKSFCSKKKEIELKFKKLNPENAKSNN